MSHCILWEVAMLDCYEQLVYLASNPISDFKAIETTNGDVINSSKLMLKNLQKEFEVGATFVYDFRQACEQAISYTGPV